MKQKCIATLSALAVLFNMFSHVYATNSTGLTTMTPEEYVLLNVSVLAETDPDCPWGDQTTLTTVTPLFNLDDTINAYVMGLSTNGFDSGFVQIHYLNGNYSLYCYAYDGYSEIDCISDYWEYDLSDDRIYFLGCFKYLIMTDSGYLDLASNTIITETQDDLQAVQEEYALQVTSAPVSTEAIASSVPTTCSVIPANLNEDYDWPITSDFAGMTITYNGNTQTVDAHCTPTAATGIIGYLDYIGQITMPAGDTTYETFEKLYISLNTNNIRFTSTTPTGTAVNQGDVGIRWYASTYGCDVTAYMDSSTSLSRMKSCLDDGYLLLVSVNDFDGTTGGHSISVIGYSASTLRVKNTWTRNTVNYSYSSLDIVNFCYVG